MGETKTGVTKKEEEEKEENREKGRKEG